MQRHLVPMRGGFCAKKADEMTETILIENGNVLAEDGAFSPACSVLLNGDNIVATGAAADQQAGQISNVTLQKPPPGHSNNRCARRLREPFDDHSTQQFPTGIAGVMLQQINASETFCRSGSFRRKQQLPRQRFQIDAFDRSQPTGGFKHDRRVTAGRDHTLEVLMKLLTGGHRLREIGQRPISGPKTTARN